MPREPVDPQHVAIEECLELRNWNFCNGIYFLQTKSDFFGDKICEIYKNCENRNLGFAIWNFEKIEIRVNDSKTPNSLGLRISKCEI